MLVCSVADGKIHTSTIHPAPSAPVTLHNRRTGISGCHLPSSRRRTHNEGFALRRLGRGGLLAPRPVFSWINPRITRAWFGRSAPHMLGVRTRHLFDDSTARPTGAAHGPVVANQSDQLRLDTSDGTNRRRQHVASSVYDLLAQSVDDSLPVFHKRRSQPSSNHHFRSDAFGAA